MIECPYKPGQILKLRGELLDLRDGGDPDAIHHCRITCVRPGKYIVVQTSRPTTTAEHLAGTWQAWSDTFRRIYFSEIDL